MRQSLTRHQKRPARIGLKHSVPLLQAYLIQRSRLKQSGVIHHHIQPAKYLSHGMNCRAN